MIIKSVEKEKAISLRKKGFSYREILKEVPVAKSTLTLWLHSVGLSKFHKQRLTQKRLDAAKRGAQKRHEQRMQRWTDIKQIASKEISKPLKQERWFMGIVLYWAEGSKEKEYSGATNLKFSNSDPFMILFFRSWMKEFLGISQERIGYQLQIHEKADWKGSRTYWSNKLDIDPERIRVHFKRHNLKPGRKNIGREYHGVLRIYGKKTIDDVRKISGWIDGISQYCGVVQR